MHVHMCRRPVSARTLTIAATAAPSLVRHHDVQSMQPDGPRLRSSAWTRGTTTALPSTSSSPARPSRCPVRHRVRRPACRPASRTEVHDHLVRTLIRPCSRGPGRTHRPRGRPSPATGAALGRQRSRVGYPAAPAPCRSKWTRSLDRLLLGCSVGPRRSARATGRTARTRSGAASAHERPESGARGRRPQDQRHRRQGLGARGPPRAGGTGSWPGGASLSRAG